MTGTIGIDTSFLIDYFKGESSAIEFMREHSGLLRVSELVMFEFLCGRLTERQKVFFLQAMQSFPHVGFDAEAAICASDMYRKGKKNGKTVNQPDCLVAGSYLANGVTSIVTKNSKDFEKIADIDVLSY